MIIIKRTNQIDSQINQANTICICLALSKCCLQRLDMIKRVLVLVIKVGNIDFFLYKMINIIRYITLLLCYIIKYTNI